MLGLVNCDMIQVTSMIDFVGSSLDYAASSLDVLQLRLRLTAALPEALCNSGSELCRICMQKEKSLCAEVCRSIAAEEGSGKV